MADPSKEEQEQKDEILPTEVLAKLREKYPAPQYALRAFKKAGQVFVIRNATAAEWDQYVADNNPTQSLAVIYGRCIVYPSSGEVLKFFQRYPAAKTGKGSFIYAITELSGGGEEIDPKDL